MTPDDDGLRPALSPDQVPVQPEPGSPASTPANDTVVVHDRRRPLRDLAGHELQRLSSAEKVSLVAYWASVAPAAFLLAVEAFEQDTRW